jgi:hypothetical protein
MNAHFDLIIELLTNDIKMRNNIIVKIVQINIMLHYKW